MEFIDNNIYQMKSNIKSLLKQSIIHNQWYYFVYCPLYNIQRKYSNITHQFSSVQSLSHVQLSATPWTTTSSLLLSPPPSSQCQASLSITNTRNPPKPMSIESVMPSNHLILCRPLLLLPSIFPSIRVFSNESALRIGWPNYWSWSFNISPSNEHPELISFRIEWLDLLAVQGTLKSLIQHHSSKASVLWCSAFFIVQLSHIHTWPLEKP